MNFYSTYRRRAFSAATLRWCRPSTFLSLNDSSTRSSPAIEITSPPSIFRTQYRIESWRLKHWAPFMGFPYDYQKRNYHDPMRKLRSKLRLCNVRVRENSSPQFLSTVAVLGIRASVSFSLSSILPIRMLFEALKKQSSKQFGCLDAADAAPQ